MLCGGRQVNGGIIYGHAYQPHTSATQTRTDELCQAMRQRIVDNCRGLRFIAGDLNQDHDSLPSMRQWADLGWVNVQKWAFDKLGKPMLPTCKGVNIRDRIFVSPELAAYLVDAQVQDDWFTDHAIVFALFTPLGDPPMIPLWRQPRELPWHELPELPDQPSLEEQWNASARPTDQYRAIWHAVEQRAKLAASQTPTLSKSCLGRATTMEVTLTQEYASPPKLGRKGDPQPGIYHLDLRHAQHLRQLRRLVNWAKLLAKPSRNATQQEHLIGTWNKIKEAAGFTHSFHTRWKDANLEPLLPNHPMVTPEVAEQISQSFEKYLRRWEQELRQSRVHTAKQRRQDDPNVIFQDLKAEPPKPIQMLLDTSQARAVAVNHDSQAIEVEPNQEWQEQQPVSIAEQGRNIIHAEPDKLWVDDVSNCKERDIVLQQVPIGNLHELFSRFGLEWSKRWDRHQDADPAAWNEILGFADLVLPRLPPMQYQRITREMWTQAVRRKPSKAAVGPDGIAKQDLLRMPADLTDKLLELLYQVEQGQEWPTQAMQGFVKHASASAPGHYRPITILSLAYRVRGSIRAREILRHLAAWCTSTCAGNLPNRSAGEVWHHILGEIETAQCQNQPLSGGVVDLVKAFNLIPRYPVMYIMERFNVAVPILRGWNQALHQLRRRFRIRSAV